MARFVALLWLATTVLGSPCTEEGCDNSQDSHLLQVTGKAASLQTTKAWDGNDEDMITNACVVWDGTVDGPGFQGLITDDRLGLDLAAVFGAAPEGGSYKPFAERCGTDKPFGDGKGNEVRCGTNPDKILACVNSYFAYLNKHRDGMSAAGQEAWGVITGRCREKLQSAWKVHSAQISSDDVTSEELLQNMVSGACGTALAANPYFASGGWGDDIAEAFGVDTSVAGGDVKIVFSYPESTVDEFMTANHGLAQTDSWASMNPVFCGASGNGNIAHRCLVPGTSVGGEPVELNGDAYQAITFDDCKRQAKACESCIHTAGILESGMNGLPAMSGMWQQTFPGSVTSPNAVGKCCLYSAPCSPEFQEAPRHRQNVIANGVQTSELARIAFDLVVH